jgi:hypothetical protein
MVSKSLVKMAAKRRVWTEGFAHAFEGGYKFAGFEEDAGPCVL